MLDDAQRGLTQEKLQLFMAGLSGLDAEEVRKAKLLFIRNEISQLEAIKKIAGFGFASGCISVFPIFWPVFAIQRQSMNVVLDLQKKQIENALSVWEADLGEEGRQLAMKLQSLK